MTFKGKATIHGKGFAIGIEVEDESYASDVGHACRKNGLLVSAEEDLLMLFPALTITRQIAQRGLDIFRKIPLGEFQSVRPLSQLWTRHI